MMSGIAHLHYCFGMAPDFGGKPFSFVHYLAVRLAKQTQPEATILWHYRYLPSGEWWDRARDLVELRECHPVDDVFGNPVEHPAHKADLIRLWALRDHGGAYMDLDVWPFRDLGDFGDCPCVLGIQGRSAGLCNAVIIAQPYAEFILRWIDEYHDFDGGDWDRHSVRRPLELAEKHPHLLHIQPEGAFFWPHFEEPDEVFIESPAAATRQRIGDALASNQRIDRRFTQAAAAVYGPDSARSMFIRRERNLVRLQRSYAVHLWESKWWDRYLSRVTPEWVAESTCVLAERVRQVLRADIVAELLEAKPV